MAKMHGLVEFIYGTVLKGGKQTAGMAAFYGAGTASMSLGEMALALPKILGIGIEDLWARAFKGRKGPEAIRDRLRGIGFNVDEAIAGSKAAEAPWEARIKQFEAALAEASKMAKALENPKPPDFTTPSIPPKLSRQALETPTDPLVRVGNFLGAGSNRIAQLAEKRTQLLQQIATNTKPRPRSGRTFTGDAEPTFFPIT